MNEKTICADVAIFGGGIAGLWLLNRLRTLNYQALLLETNKLGNGQTINSQGIIHGGIKFALTGFLTGSANAVEAMPKRWKNCLEGNGEIDLRSVKILSNDQLLWSTGSLHSEIASFFASKALNSRVQKLSHDQYPPVLQNTAFKGHVYRLEEIVLDTSSLIHALAKPHQNCIFKIDPIEEYKFLFQPNNPQYILSFKSHSGKTRFNLEAKRYIFTAGEGNEQLASLLPNSPAMQRRPLQMVLVKFNTRYTFFAHCIDHGTNPRITITTHFTQDGKTVWYLGGQLAEEGVQRTSTQQIEVAKKELKTLLPWLDLTGSEWASFFINRSESKQPDGKRPDTVFTQAIGNTIIGWPTKLALSPLLADECITLLKKQSFLPSATSLEPLLAELDSPQIAPAPWEALFT
jgi:glycerol-3-phosphate dehydrogenase